MKKTTLKEELLISGLDDWSYAGWVLQTVRLSGLADYAALRALSIGLIAELITEGLVVPGEIDNKDHVPWRCTNGEAIERITAEWLKEWADESPTPGAIVWLDNTPAGDEIARAALDREKA